MRTLTIVAALVIWAGVAEGGFYTGNDLSERCKSEGTIGPDLCRGYVTGSADTLTNTGKISLQRAAPRLWRRQRLAHGADRGYQAAGLGRR